MSASVMANKALKAALQAPQETSPATYRDLVESLITEAEVDEAQERAWQRQRRSELRIAELEAREDARAGYTQLGEEANSWNGNTGLRGQGASSSDDASPPPKETESHPQAVGDEIQALKVELARSVVRETDSSRKLQAHEAQPAKHKQELGSHLGDRNLDFGQREMTTTETSEWESDSESGSQDMMSAESSRVEMFQSATSASESELVGRQNQYSQRISNARSSRASKSERPPQETDKVLEKSSVENGGRKESTALDGPSKPLDDFKSSTVEVESRDGWTAEIDASRPQTPTSWEAIALEKSEQLEEAKLLLGAVMEGERTALETVARLELELQENRANVSRSQRAARKQVSVGREPEEGDRRHASRSVRMRANGVRNRSEAAKSIQSSQTSSSSNLDRSGDEYESKSRRLVAASMDSEPAVAASPDSARPSSQKQPNGLHGTQANLDGMDQDSEETAKATLQELEAKELVYRNHCEVLQQQVRKALEQVELLRKQQREKEARDLALYEGRLSAYVKQMVAVRRDNEALMVQQRALQAEKQHLQEQLEAEHQKRREECHEAQAQVHSLSDSLSEASDEVLRWTTELHKARTQFEDTNSGDALELLRCKDREGSVSTSQEAMQALRTEIMEQIQALERAADIKKQLADEKAYTARLRGERDKMEKLSQQFEAEVEKLRLEKGEAEQRGEHLKVRVAELEVLKQKHEKQVSSLEKQLVERERSLTQYKAEIHKELAGLSQHMHEAATQRAREDSEFREAIQKSESLLQEKEARIRELEGEVKELREALEREKEASERIKKAYEKEEREWAQKSQTERERFFETTRRAYEDREREWGQKLQAKREKLRDSELEVQRLQELAASQENEVADLKRDMLGNKEQLEREHKRLQEQENKVADFKREMLGKKEQLERDHEEQRQAMMRELGRQEEELEWLRQQLEARDKKQWDEERKEQLVAEVQGILEEYSIGQQLGMERLSSEEPSKEEAGSEESAHSRREGKTVERSTAFRHEKKIIETNDGAVFNENEPGGLRNEKAGATQSSGEEDLQARVAYAWAEREGRFSEDEESVRIEYETEIASLKEKVRLLEGKGDDNVVFGQAPGNAEGRTRATAVEETNAQRNGLQAASVVSNQTPERVKHSDDHSVRLSPEGGQSLSMQGGARHALAFVKGEETSARQVALQAATVLSQRVMHSFAIDKAAKHCAEDSEGGQSLDSGQSGAWSDKRPNEEEPRTEVEQKARDQLVAEKGVLMEENGALKAKVTELQLVNQELQLRVKLLEEDRLKLLDKIASSQSPPSAQVADGRLALELAAVQAHLAEAIAKAAEQKSRYKHLKGKYLRQMARQQAMQEYMLQGGDSPANLSPRSGVAPFIGRPGTATDTINPFGKSPLRSESESRLDATHMEDASFKSPLRKERDSRLETWQESSGDLGADQRQALVAQKTRTVNGHIQRSRQSLEAQDDNRSSGFDERNTSRRSGQRQIDGRGLSIQEHPAERGPSSGNGQAVAGNRFSSQASYRTSTISSRSVSVGKSRSSYTTPNTSVPPSRRQSSTDSVLAQSGIPVGLRVLMDGRPLPGFPAKVEDLGGYFAEARAQSDGSRGVRLPTNRVSVPYLRKREDRRVSRASSAPPMRPSYNQSGRVWV